MRRRAARWWCAVRTASCGTPHVKSGCAFSLRIDERRECGHGAPHPPRPPDPPRPPGSPRPPGAPAAAARAPPGALPAVHPPVAPFVVHRRLSDGDGHERPSPIDSRHAAPRPRGPDAPPPGRPVAGHRPPATPRPRRPAAPATTAGRSGNGRRAWSASWAWAAEWRDVGGVARRGRRGALAHAHAPGQAVVPGPRRACATSPPWGAEVAGKGLEAGAGGGADAPHPCSPVGRQRIAGGAGQLRPFARSRDRRRPPVPCSWKGRPWHRARRRRQHAEPQAL